MQDATVRSTANDGRIGRAARTVAHELMQQFCFDLVLRHTRPANLHGALVSQTGNPDRLPDGRDFLPAFV